MLTFLRAAFVLSLLAGQALSASNAGSPDCPCVPPDFESSTYWRAGELWVPLPSAGLSPYNGSDFGSHCKAWEEGIDPACQEAPIPAECARSYCYVRSANCNVASYPSTYFPAMGLQYSYLTCGDSAGQDEFNQQVADQLEGLTIRFAYPAPSRPWHYIQDDHWTGSVASFFQELESTAGFRGVQQDVSNASLSLYGSPWDACVHDVRMGVLDFCVSVVMETDTRRQMASFSSPIMAGSMRLLAKKDVSDNRWDPANGYESVWFSFLKPFSVNLWILTLLMILLAGAIFRVVEDRMTKLCTCQVLHLGGDSANGMYEGFTAFFAGGDIGHGHATTKAGKTIRMAYAVFAMIMVATYTANLAQLLVVDAQTNSGIQSIDSCDPPTDLCQKVCVLVQQLSLVRAQHPTLVVQQVTNSVDLLRGVANGDCDAAIVPEHDAMARQDWQEEMCNSGLQLVGGAIFTVYVGLAARGDLVNALSFHTLTLVYQGKFAEYYDTFRYKLIDTCLDQERSEEDDSELKVEDMAGFMLIFAIVTVVSLLVHCCRAAFRSGKGSTSNEAATESNGTAVTTLNDPEVSAEHNPQVPVAAKSPPMTTV